jgi:nitrogen regulatory protein PII
MEFHLLIALKKIEAIVRRERFEQVDAALKAIGVGGLTLEEVKGRGRTRIVTTVYPRESLPMKKSTSSTLRSRSLRRMKMRQRWWTRS